MDWQSSFDSDPPYCIVESPTFESQFTGLVNNPKLRDDLKNTFDLDLARNPSAFQRIPGTKLRAVTIACSPPLTVYFTVDKKNRRVTLQEIHKL